VIRGLKQIGIDERNDY